MAAAGEKGVHRQEPCATHAGRGVGYWSCRKRTLPPHASKPVKSIPIADLRDFVSAPRLAFINIPDELFVQLRYLFTNYIVLVMELV